MYLFLCAIQVIVNEYVILSVLYYYIIIIILYIIQVYIDCDFQHS